MLTPRNPKMPKKTTDQIVQTDHLTGHATDQTFFSHLASIFFTFTGPTTFRI